MNDPHQIAAEAARKCAWNRDHEKQILPIIQSAIEKAHEDGYRQGAIDGVLNERESRAARASEQGETLETLRSCRDHWKTAFEHERGKVIRLSNQIHAIHGKKCICTICELVKTKSRAAHGTSAVADASEPLVARVASMQTALMAIREHAAQLRKQYPSDQRTADIITLVDGNNLLSHPARASEPRLAKATTEGEGGALLRSATRRIRSL